MPHERPRYLESLIAKALKSSPLVGVLGQRQTGKTSLVLRLVGDPSKNRYVSLDDPTQLESVRYNPRAFVAERTARPFAIDECQLAPELFPALKLHVQEHKARGQFLLTGSVRFTSRKLIRESLTGRIENLQLLPFTLNETSSKPLGNIFEVAYRGDRALAALADRTAHTETKSAVAKYLNQGGLPGICFFRDSETRERRFASHLETLLDRDLRLITPTTVPYPSLLRLLRLLAERQGELMDVSKFSSLSRISSPTVTKLIAAFEGIFLVRRLEPIGERGKAMFFLEDQGMATSLGAGGVPERDRLRALFSELQAQAVYHGHSNGQLFFYRTRGGAGIPFCMRNGKRGLGLLPIFGEVPDRSSLLSARSYLRQNPSHKVLLLTKGKQSVPFGSDLTAIPWTAIYQS